MDLSHHGRFTGILIHCFITGGSRGNDTKPTYVFMFLPLSPRPAHITYCLDYVDAANEWNKLSTDCVNANSVNTFKNKIDKYLRRAGYT